MSEYRFEEADEREVFVCERVLYEGAPVLFVSHDDNGDWQFLCGHGHSEEGADEPVLVCLKDIVERDVTLNDIADLSPLETAERDELGGSWRIHDGMEDIVRANVREHACHVMKVQADELGPAFAYSIGLTRSFGQPELICFGLDDETMHFIINELRDRMAAGTRFTGGQSVPGLLPGHDCVLKRVSSRYYDDYLGYAEWFHGSRDFEALQIVWPDERGRFPWDVGCAGPSARQPATWEEPAPVASANPSE